MNGCEEGIENAPVAVAGEVRKVVRVVLYLQVTDLLCFEFEWNELTNIQQTFP